MALALFLSNKRRQNRNSPSPKNWQNSSKKEVILEALEDVEVDTVAVEAMVVAEEAAVDLEDKEAAVEDSVEAAEAHLAVVEVVRCVVAAWAEVVVDHSLTEHRL